MQKWEYNELTFHWLDKEIVEKLNRFGEVGWECYSVITFNDEKNVCYHFKRPKLST